MSSISLKLLTHSLPLALLGSAIFFTAPESNADGIRERLINNNFNFKLNKHKYKHKLKHKLKSYKKDGKASGDEMNSNKDLWISTDIGQDKSKASYSSNYTSDNVGVSLGFDYDINDWTSVGFSYNYDKSKSMTNNSLQSQTNNDYSQIGMSLNRSLTDTLGASFSVGYGVNTTEQKGTFLAGDQDNLKMYSLSVSAEAYKEIVFGSGLVITPSFGFDYNNSYQKDASRAGYYNDLNNYALNAVFGAEMSKSFTYKDSTIVPSLHVNLYQNLNQTVSQVDVKRNGFLSRLSPSDNSDLIYTNFNVGTALELVREDNFNANLSYDYTTNKNQYSHSGSLTLTAKF